MHKKNDAICIGENSKVTQHDPYLENSYVGDDEYHIEATNFHILAVNATNNNAPICQI